MADYDPTVGAAREAFCRLLAACYYEPGREFAEEKVFDAMHQAASRIDRDLAGLAGRLGEAFTAGGVDNLLIDYSRLFLGPPQAIARPYASVWTGGEQTLMQASTLEVLEFYHEGGFEIAEDFRELPDHVAAELEFLYLLIFRENQTHQTGAPDASAPAGHLRARFLTHLASWIGPFAAAMKSGARTNFYQALAMLTDRFVAMEAGRR